MHALLIFFIPLNENKGKVTEVSPFDYSQLLSGRSDKS